LPTTAGLGEEPDCVDDCWQPSALIRLSRPYANRQARQSARFRATEITAYLEAGGTLENAQAMAARKPARDEAL
jgi:hypothetical protein